MAKTIPVAKTNFAAGEIHPSLHPCVDTPQYAMGMKTIKNSIVFPHGGIGNRAGTERINAVKGVGTNVRLKDFTFSTGDAYILEFGNLYIRFYKNGAVLGAPYEVVTPYTSADLAELDFAHSADTIVITHPDYQQQLLTRFADTTWTLTDYDYENGPFMPLNFDAASTITPSATTGNVVLTAANNIFSNITGEKHATNRTLWQINELIGSQLVSHSFGATGQSSNIKCGGTWRIVTHGTWTGTIQIEMSLDGGTSWIPVRSLASNNTQNYNTYGTEDYSQFLIRVKCTAYTSGTILVDLSSDPFLWRGVARITQVPSGGGGGSQMYATADATVLTTLASAAATADWAEGAWSKYRGYPHTATYYQDRLVFGNTEAEPHTIWLSKTGIYLDYGRSSPLIASDGMTLNLPSRQLNGITALVPLRNLLVLTTGGEWSVVPAAEGLAPTTPPGIESHGNHGAANAAPVVVGERALYIQNRRASLRDTAYSEETGGFSGNDLSAYAPHLFAGHEIVEMAYQRTPYGILWLVRDDGVLLSLTYNHALGVNAWTWHDTEGLFKSVCTLPGDGEDEVWFVVERSGATGRGVERMQQRSVSGIPEDQYYVDCGHIEEGAEYVINNATADNPGLFLSIGHSLINGDIVRLNGLVGNPADDSGFGGLNDLLYNVYDVSGDFFKLKIGATGITPLDTSDMGVYENDSGIVKIAVHTVAGLTWLNNKIVSVLVDGMPYTHTITGNTLTLGNNIYGSYIQVGFGYISDVEIIPINLTAKQSLLGLEIDIPLLKAWLADSLGGKAGYDEDHLQSFEWEEGFVFGNSLLLPRYENAPIKRDLFSGNVKLSLDTKTEGNRSIMIRQDQPLPMTILAIIPFVSVPE